MKRRGAPRRVGTCRTSRRCCGSETTRVSRAHLYIFCIYLPHILIVHCCTQASRQTATGRTCVATAERAAYGPLQNRFVAHSFHAARCLSSKFIGEHYLSAPLPFLAGAGRWPVRRGTHDVARDQEMHQVALGCHVPQPDLLAERARAHRGHRSRHLGKLGGELLLLGAPCERFLRGVVHLESGNERVRVRDCAK